MIPSQEKEEPKEAGQVPTRHSRLEAQGSTSTSDRTLKVEIVGYVHLVCVSPTALKCPLQKPVFSTLLL